MNVLLLGADGFLGRHLQIALETAGHTVRRGVHRPVRRADEIAVDYARDAEPGAWRGRLTGIDAVINTVGILREARGRRFDAIHDQAPRGLFAACRETGVRRVIQVSALGADAGAASRFHLSKRAADDYLATLDLEWVILQPAFVYGIDGASSRMFRQIASLPLLPVLGSGQQWIQPIHIDDLCLAMVRLLLAGAVSRRRIPLVGPVPLTYRDYLCLLRAGMGLGPAPVLHMPTPLLRASAWIGERLPGAVLIRENLAMLERGNTADAAMTETLLGRAPRPVATFIEPQEATLLAREARLCWLLGIMRVCLALVWIGSGVVSLGLYPVARNLDLLAAVGLTGRPALAALYFLSLFDIAIGLLVLCMRRKWLWGVQILVVLGYTLVVTAALPEFWLHPFGPLLKNLPILAGLTLLFYLERR
jgi:uncharacterized protein YbjT (DUF2867 family)